MGLKEVALRPNLFALHFDEQMVFDDFIKKSFRFKTIYRRILESSVYRYFTAAAPGFKELIVLDAIREFLERARPRFDRVLIDAPATGHGISYFEVAHQALRTFKVGSLHRKALAVQSMVTDRANTGTLIVTLAEEMPVNESIELEKAIRGKLSLDIDAIVINGIFPSLSRPMDPEALERLREAAPFFASPDLARGFSAAGLFHHARNQINRHHIERLQGAMDAPQIQIPFLADEAKDVEFLEEVAKFLTREASVS